MLFVFQVYETAVHENIDFDGHTWADVEAHEDEECTRGKERWFGIFYLIPSWCSVK